MHHRKVDSPIAKRSSAADDAASAEEPVNFTANLQRQMWALLFLGSATYGLYDIDFVEIILSHQKIDRPAFNLGVAICSAIMVCAGYLDVYRGSIMGERVDYAHCRTTTHIIVGLLAAATIVLNYALWGVWGWYTPLILFMFTWGFLLQIILLVPPTVYKFLFFGIYMWFMHHQMGFGFI